MYLYASHVQKLVDNHLPTCTRLTEVNQENLLHDLLKIKNINKDQLYKI
jgi:hypothetical protein